MIQKFMHLSSIFENNICSWDLFANQGFKTNKMLSFNFQQYLLKQWRTKGNLIFFLNYISNFVAT